MEINNEILVNALIEVVRNDEALCMLVENGTVNDSDYENANAFLYYYFNKFDLLYEHFIPSTLVDEDLQEIYKVNFEFMIDFLKLELV